MELGLEEYLSKNCKSTCYEQMLPYKNEILASYKKRYKLSEIYNALFEKKIISCKYRQFLDAFRRLQDLIEE